MPTLRALLVAPTLELEHVDGDPDTPFLAVRYPWRPTDRPWLAEGDLRLLDAAAADADVEWGRSAVERLLSPRPAAVVYARSTRKRTTPTTLVKQAAVRQVPLVVLPPHVNIARLELEALRLLALESEGRVDASVQRYLLRTLSSPKPERDLLNALSELSGGSFVLLAPWGDLLARSGPRTWRGDPEAASRLPEGPMRIAGRSAMALRVEAGGRLRAVLLALDDAAPVHLLELARSLLSVTALSRSAEASRDEARRAALLTEWLANPSRSVALEPRLRQAGIDLDNPFVVAIAESRSMPGSGPQALPVPEHVERLKHAGDDLFRSLGIGALSEVREHRCVWLFAGGTPEAHAAALNKALTAAADGGTVGLGFGKPTPDPTRVADTYRQALLALETLPRSGGVAHFDAFDPVYWVLRQQPAERLETLRERLLGPLLEADERGKLWTTLQAYLRSPGDLGALADELGIHVNTLRYRIRRIETLLGQPLGQPRTLARLYMAEAVDGMLADEDA